MSVKFGFAGDRRISVDILKFLLENGYPPEFLFYSDHSKSSHAEDLISLCSFLDPGKKIPGSRIGDETTINLISAMNLDYLICIHFPYIISKRLLAIPNIGVLNLHPAYLPYNRGWNTPTWTIIDKTPYGATLHFMDSTLDTGDIIRRQELPVFPDDTADTLYQKVLNVETELFKDAWPDLVKKDFQRIRQNPLDATVHKKGDIRTIQEINLDEQTTARELMNRIRALTTNDINESAFFTDNGTRYRIRLEFKKIEEDCL